MVRLCDMVGRSQKSLGGDWSGAEGTKVMKLKAEPPKIRGCSSPQDTDLARLTD